MNFVTFSYIVFLLILCLFYYIFPKVSRPFILLAASLVFYVYDVNNAGFVVFLLSVSAITYISGILIDKINTDYKIARISILTITLLLCFGALIYYKYSYFIFGTAFSLAIPLGISYFTLSSTGYLIDMYRKKYESEKNFLYHTLFVSFFPNIVAGPIERSNNLIPQFKKPISFDYKQFSGGLFRILWGFFKKLVIANTLMAFVQPIFADIENYPGPVLIVACLVFAYQIYTDFSALSDIAIGTGAIFGITVMENFKSPLTSCSIIDLWRRWHISLSSWFRDYLYFPLGGSRKGKLRSIINTLIVFAVSGLWHDASMGYLYWGLVSGIYLIVGRETLPLREKIHAKNPLYYFKPIKSFIQIIITYVLFSLSIVFIAAELYGTSDSIVAESMYFFGNFFKDFDLFFDDTISNVFYALGFENIELYVVLAGIIVIEGLESSKLPINIMIRKVPFFLRWPLYYALLLAIFFFGRFGVSAFVYQAY